MEKSSRSVIIGVIILAIIAVVIGIVLTHKSSPAKSTTSKTSDTVTVNNATLKTKTSSSLGAYLTEPDGKPLYTYSSDSANMSNCSSTCLQSWPPYVDTGATTGLAVNVSTITRTDSGVKQYTYKGLPLYTFTSDSGTQPTGNGVGGFSVAHP